ncbi:MAG: hypothetical protein K0R28_666 [Paenibacillus sp.]|jgi:hypothetical protein|nr:hypothetical protein [Paenibacillus sp.]
MSQELSPSGQPIYRHTQSKKREADFVVGNDQTIQAISEHVEKYIGKIDYVIHEIVSDLIHLDILVVKPTRERNYYSFVTCGMSDLPMTVPEGAENFKFAELMICLPGDWNVSQTAFEQEEHYWPIRWLKDLARLPHEYATWLYLAHTVPNGSPPQPYATNTKLSGMLLAPPSVTRDPKDFFTLTLPNRNQVHFFSLIPLYTEEMDLKLERGADHLFGKLEKAGVNEILDIKRRNVAQKRFLFF